MTRWGEFDDLYRISELDGSQDLLSEGRHSPEGQYQSVYGIFLNNIKHDSQMFTSYSVLPYELIYMHFLSIPKGLATCVTALLMWSMSCSGGNLRHRGARVVTELLRW